MSWFCGFPTHPLPSTSALMRDMKNCQVHANSPPVCADLSSFTVNGELLIEPEVIFLSTLLNGYIIAADKFVKLLHESHDSLLCYCEFLIRIC